MSCARAYKAHWHVELALPIITAPHLSALTVRAPGEGTAPSCRETLAPLVSTDPFERICRLKCWHLVWAALRRKPTRTILTVLSVVTAFFLFGALQGVNVGLANSIDSIKGTHLRISSRNGVASTLPVSHVARIARVPGVREVTGVAMLFGRIAPRNTIVLVSACDLEAMFRIYTEMSVPKEQVANALRCAPA
jgi:hypothetical protein